MLGNKIKDLFGNKLKSLMRNFKDVFTKRPDDPFIGFDKFINLIKMGIRTGRVEHDLLGSLGAVAKQYFGEHRWLVRSGGAYHVVLRDDRINHSEVRLQTIDLPTLRLLLPKDTTAWLEGHIPGYAALVHNLLLLTPTAMKHWCATPRPMVTQQLDMVSLILQDPVLLLAAHYNAEHERQVLQRIYSIDGYTVSTCAMLDGREWHEFTANDPSIKSLFRLQELDTNVELKFYIHVNEC